MHDPSRTRKRRFHQNIRRLRACEIIAHLYLPLVLRRSFFNRPGLPSSAREVDFAQLAGVCYEPTPAITLRCLLSPSHVSDSNASLDCSAAHAPLPQLVLGVGKSSAPRPFPCAPAK